MPEPATSLPLACHSLACAHVCVSSRLGTRRDHPLGEQLEEELDGLEGTDVRELMGGMFLEKASPLGAKARIIPAAVELEIEDVDDAEIVAPVREEEEADEEEEVVTAVEVEAEVDGAGPAKRPKRMPAAPAPVPVPPTAPRGAAARRPRASRARPKNEHKKSGPVPGKKEDAAKEDAAAKRLKQLEAGKSSTYTYTYTYTCASEYIYAYSACTLQACAQSESLNFSPGEGRGAPNCGRSHGLPWSVA